MSPVLSQNGEFIFVVGASGDDLFCLDTVRGRNVWIDSLSNEIRTRPIYSEDENDSVLYVIEVRLCAFM